MNFWLDGGKSNTTITKLTEIIFKRMKKRYLKHSIEFWFSICFALFGKSRNRASSLYILFPQPIRFVYVYLCVCTWNHITNRIWYCSKFARCAAFTVVLLQWICCIADIVQWIVFKSFWTPIKCVYMYTYRDMWYTNWNKPNLKHNKPFNVWCNIHTHIPPHKFAPFLFSIASLKPAC